MSARVASPSATRKYPPPTVSAGRGDHRQQHHRGQREIDQRQHFARRRQEDIAGLFLQGLGSASACLRFSKARSLTFFLATARVIFCLASHVADVARRSDAIDVQRGFLDRLGKNGDGRRRRPRLRLRDPWQDIERLQGRAPLELSRRGPRGQQIQGDIVIGNVADILPSGQSLTCSAVRKLSVGPSTGTTFRDKVAALGRIDRPEPSVLVRHRDPENASALVANLEVHIAKRISIGIEHTTRDRAGARTEGGRKIGGAIHRDTREQHASRHSRAQRSPRYRCLGRHIRRSHRCHRLRWAQPARGT